MFSSCFGDDENDDGKHKRRRKGLKNSLPIQNSTDYYIDYYSETLSPKNGDNDDDDDHEKGTPPQSKIGYIKASDYYEGVDPLLPSSQEIDSSKNKEINNKSSINNNKNLVNKSPTKRNVTIDDVEVDAVSDDGTVQFNDEDDDLEDFEDDDEPVPHLSRDGRKVIYYPPTEPPPVPLPPSTVWTGGRRKNSRSRSRSPSTRNQNNNNNSSSSSKSPNRQQQHQSKNPSNGNRKTLATRVAKRVAIENGQYAKVVEFVEPKENTKNAAAGILVMSPRERQALSPSDDFTLHLQEVKQMIEGFYHHNHHQHHASAQELESKLITIVSMVDNVVTDLSKSRELFDEVKRQHSSGNNNVSSSIARGGTNSNNNDLAVFGLGGNETDHHSPLYDRIFGPPASSANLSPASTTLLIVNDNNNDNSSVIRNQINSSSSLSPSQQEQRKEKEKQQQEYYSQLQQEQTENEELLAWLLNEAGFIIDSSSEIFEHSSSYSTSKSIVNVDWKEQELKMYQLALQVNERLYQGEDNSNWALSIANVASTMIEIEERRQRDDGAMAVSTSDDEKRANNTKKHNITDASLVVHATEDPNAMNAIEEGVELLRVSVAMNRRLYSNFQEQISGQRSPSTATTILLRTDKEQREMNSFTSEFATSLREAGQIFTRLGLYQESVELMKEQVKVLKIAHEQNETRKRRRQLLKDDEHDGDGEIHHENDEETGQEDSKNDEGAMIGLDWIASALNELGFCYLKAKENDEGLQHLLQALEIMRTLQDGEDDNELSKLMNNCGLYLCESGKRRDGLPLLKESIEMKRRLLFEEELEFRLEEKEFQRMRSNNSKKKKSTNDIKLDEKLLDLNKISNLRPSETFAIMLWNCGLQFEKMIADLNDECAVRMQHEEANHHSPKHQRQQRTINDDDDNLVDCEEDQDHSVFFATRHQFISEESAVNISLSSPHLHYHENLTNDDGKKHNMFANSNDVSYNEEEFHLFVNFVQCALEMHSQAHEMFKRVDEVDRQGEGMMNGKSSTNNNTTGNPWINRSMEKVGRLMTMKAWIGKQPDKQKW